MHMLPLLPNVNQVETKCSVTCIFSTKGGIGKTTICCNLAAYLADAGYQVLIIDADPQQSANEFYKVTKTSSTGAGLTHFIKGDEPAHECVSNTDVDRLDIILGNDIDRRLSSWIKQSTNRGTAMKFSIAPLREIYDFIFIDTQGSDGSGDVQELAIRAADIILFPITPEALETRESLNNGFTVLERLAPRDKCDTYNAIPTPHVIIYKHDTTNPAHSEYVSGLRTHLGEKQLKGEVCLLETEVPKSNVYNSAQAGENRIPVHRHDPIKRSRVQKKPCAAECLRSIAEELYGLDIPEALPSSKHNKSQGIGLSRHINALIS